eukprot:Pgem_evm1s10812
MIDPRMLVFDTVSVTSEKIFVTFMLVIFGVLSTSAYFLFTHFTYVHGIIHTLLVIYIFGETFMSILHCSSHKPIFKESVGVLNYFIPFFCVPFMGQTWYTYFAHHVKHHHVEGNGDKDLSSTEGYQRDSFLHFLHYVLRKGEYGHAIKVFLGETGTLVSWSLLAYYVNFKAAFFVFFLPLVIMRCGMMASNWGQHAFVKKVEDVPRMKVSKYTYSLTITDSYYNKIAFNDGYHASHHINASSHWSELPEQFVKQCQAEKYVDEDTIVLSGQVNFGDVWQKLMFGDYKSLAEMYRNCQTKEKSCFSEKIKRAGKTTDEDLEVLFK